MNSSEPLNEENSVESERFLEQLSEELTARQREGIVEECCFNSLQTVVETEERRLKEIASAFINLFPEEMRNLKTSEILNGDVPFVEDNTVEQVLCLLRQFDACANSFDTPVDEIQGKCNISLQKE